MEDEILIIENAKWKISKKVIIKNVSCKMKNDVRQKQIINEWYRNHLLCNSEKIFLPNLSFGKISQIGTICRIGSDVFSSISYQSDFSKNQFQCQNTKALLPTYHQLGTATSKASEYMDTVLRQN